MNNEEFRNDLGNKVQTAIGDILNALSDEEKAKIDSVELSIKFRFDENETDTPNDADDQENDDDECDVILDLLEEMSDGLEDYLNFDINSVDTFVIPLTYKTEKNILIKAENVDEAKVFIIDHKSDIEQMLNHHGYKVSQNSLEIPETAKIDLVTSLYHKKPTRIKVEFGIDLTETEENDEDETEEEDDDNSEDNTEDNSNQNDEGPLIKDSPGDKE